MSNDKRLIEDYLPIQEISRKSPREKYKKEFMEPLEITQSQLAKEIHATFRTINEIMNEKRNISPEMAIRLL